MIDVQHLTALLISRGWNHDEIESLVDQITVPDPEPAKADRSWDDVANDLVAAGGVFQALYTGAGTLLPEIVLTEEGVVTNVIRVHPEWMLSPYLVTIERDTSQDE